MARRKKDIARPDDTNSIKADLLKDIGHAREGEADPSPLHFLIL
jgi:hypothetical protein